MQFLNRNFMEILILFRVFEKLFCFLREETMKVLINLKNL